MANQQWKSTERKVADKISLWWTGEKGALRRSPLSGGWPKRGAYGDIIQVNSNYPKFPFVIDVKYRSQWDFDGFVRNPKACTMLKWWDESVDKLAVPLNQHLWFIFMRKRGTLFLMIDYVLENQMRDICGTFNIPRFCFRDCWTNPNYNLFIYKLDDYLKALDPEVLRNAQIPYNSFYPEGARQNEK